MQPIITNSWAPSHPAANACSCYYGSSPYGSVPTSSWGSEGDQPWSAEDSSLWGSSSPNTIWTDDFYYGPSKPLSSYLWVEGQILEKAPVWQPLPWVKESLEVEMEDPEMYFEKLMSVRMPLFLHDQVHCTKLLSWTEDYVMTEVVVSIPGHEDRVAAMVYPCGTQNDWDRLMAAMSYARNAILASGEHSLGLVGMAVDGKSALPYGILVEYHGGADLGQFWEGMWAKDGGFSRSPAEVLALMAKMVDAISDLHSRRIALGKVGLSSFQFALNTGGEMQIRFSDFESVVRDDMSDKEFEELKAKDVCGLARTLYMLALNGYQTEDGYGYHENVPVDDFWGALDAGDALSETILAIVYEPKNHGLADVRAVLHRLIEAETTVSEADSEGPTDDEAPVWMVPNTWSCLIC
ncbi:hypothetical protein QBZ16_004922 [Prototheca wickerhamii]|uniref:Protein kinase domain-containing protein n=1 Tax=Prototheca wickerhamii TaxID=3111 RepID=A0AAD9IFJ1_PROWI|nr:hypothetical protein QBZ16_004922 [Prototheca wickerhamii]